MGGSCQALLPPATLTATPHVRPAPGPRLTQTPLPMASRRRLHPPTLGRCSLHLNPARTPCLFSFTTACSSDTARPLLTLLWLCPQAPARLPVYTAVFLYPWGVMPHPTSPQMPWCPRPRTALNLLASDICNLLGTGLALWPVGLRDRAWDGCRQRDCAHPHPTRLPFPVPGLVGIGADTGQTARLAALS